MSQKVKDYIQCIGFLAFFLLIIIGFPVIAFIRGYEHTIYANKDSYVLESTPNANYGSEDYLRIGKFDDGRARTYYHFNISSHSMEWREAWIYVKFDLGTNLIDVGCYLTNNNWDEMAITWNTQPEPTAYKGHILCDGFDFRIPIDLDEIVDGGVSICLCEMRAEEEGYIQGYSKEGTSYKGQAARIELTYTGYDPIVFWTCMRILIFIAGLIGLITLGIIFGRHSKPIRIKHKRKHKQIPLPPNFKWDEQGKVVPKKFEPPPQMDPIEIMARYYPKSVPALEKQINQYIILKLEQGKTFIYVNGRRFIQCIRLVLNIQKEDIPIYDEIDSIDEAAKVYKNHMYQNRIVRGPMAAPVPGQRHDITPEQEFWGHCSNLEAWVENKYDTRILMSNISFPLLRELSRAGDPVARGVYKEEIALRLESGYPSVVQYLLAQGYLGEFSPDEFKTILESTGLIQKLSSDSKVLSSLLNACILKFPTLSEKIILDVLNLPNSEDLFLSIINRDILYNKLPGIFQSRIKMNRTRFLLNLKGFLERSLDQLNEFKRGTVLNCIKAIDEQLSKYDVNSPLFKGESFVNKFPLIQNPLIKNHLLEKFEKEKLKEKALKAQNKALSRCKFCGKIIPKDKDFCEWCGHKKDDDEGGFFPFPFIFKPPGGGGSMKAVAIAVAEGKSKA